jgi:hypothetical protein
MGIVSEPASSPPINPLAVAGVTAAHPMTAISLSIVVSEKRVLVSAIAGREPAPAPAPASAVDVLALNAPITGEVAAEVNAAEGVVTWAVVSSVTGWAGRDVGAAWTDARVVRPSLLSLSSSSSLSDIMIGQSCVVPT